MNSKLLWVIFIICTVFTLSTFGNNLPLNKQLKNRDAVVKSLLIGINSDNYGLRTSSAYLIGELKLSEAVIPLMRMLKNEIHEEARIMAALSLFKIGDARGIFAVKQAIRFDESQRVSKMCERLYCAYKSDLKNQEILLAGF